MYKIRKKVYSTFVDYSKAFDRVNRSILWEKLISNDVTGSVSSITKDMYLKAKPYAYS